MKYFNIYLGGKTQSATVYRLTIVLSKFREVQISPEKGPIGHFTMKREICSKTDVIYGGKNGSNVKNGKMKRKWKK